MAKVPPQIFNRRLYAYRRARAIRQGADPILVREVTERMVERLAELNRRFARALDLSSRDDAYALLESLAGSWVRTTPYPSPYQIVDEEHLPFPPNSFDLIVSVLALHAVNDLPGALIQIRRSLKPGGVFLGALYAGSTLAELRQSFAAAELEILGGTTPRVAPLADIRDLGALLQRANFVRPVADIERTTIRYREISTLFADLRRLGETNALAMRGVKPISRRLIGAVHNHYAANYTDDGRLRATFEIAYLMGWG